MVLGSSPPVPRVAIEDVEDKPCEAKMMAAMAQAIRSTDDDGCGYVQKT
jgi:hypothetical protein